MTPTLIRNMTDDELLRFVETSITVSPLEGLLAERLDAALDLLAEVPDWVMTDILEGRKDDKD